MHDDRGTSHDEIGWTIEDMVFALGPAPDDSQIECPCEGEKPSCFYCQGTGYLEAPLLEVWRRMRAALGITVDDTGRA